MGVLEYFYYLCYRICGTKVRTGRIFLFTLFVYALGIGILLGAIFDKVSLGLLITLPCFIYLFIYEVFMMDGRKLNSIRVKYNKLGIQTRWMYVQYISFILFSVVILLASLVLAYNIHEHLY